MNALRALWLVSFALLAMVATPQAGKAGSATEINADANATLRSFVDQNPSARDLGRKAAGILVFPSVINMFMTEEALAGFQNAYGWKVGVDGSIVVVTVGAGGSIDTDNLTSPIIAFILDPKGLMGLVRL